MGDAAPPDPRHRSVHLPRRPPGRRGAGLTGQERRGDAAINRALWTELNARFTDAQAQHRWGAPDITWGLFDVPERELRALGNVTGLDVVELGCGTAYFSAWLARRGARPVGVDVTPAQLDTARICMQRFGLSFPLITAGAEELPLRDGSFDLAVSEYGASVWCDPARWVPEAARVLRPGGRLVFLTNSVLVTLCVPQDEGHASEQLQRPQRGMYREQWPGGGIEFHLGHGEWIQILRASGFEVVALLELFAGAHAPDNEYYEIATAAWARRWPVEDLWVTRLTVPPTR